MPKLPPEEAEGQFSARGLNIYKLGTVVAQARSGNFARRIASALNSYKPDEHGK